MASYTRVATSPRVLQPVITQLGLPDTPTSLAANVKVTNPTTTVLLDISVTRPDAEQAAQIANAISAQLKTVVEEMAPTQTEGGVRRSTVQVTLLNEAVAPTIPAGMSLPVTGVLGVFAGFAAAFVVALLVSGIDGHVRVVDDLRRLRGGTLMAALPSTKAKGPARTDALAPHLQRAAGLLAGWRPGGEGSIVLVTSPEPDPDAAVVTEALAKAAASIGGRAAIVDLSALSPKIVVALAQGVTGTPELDLSDETVNVAVTANATGATVTEARPPDLRALTAEFDLVMLSAPPYATSADSQLISSAVDAAAVIVSMRVAKERVAATLAGLRALEAGNVVLIANRVPKRDL